MRDTVTFRSYLFLSLKYVKTYVSKEFQTTSGKIFFIEWIVRTLELEACNQKSRINLKLVNCCAYFLPPQFKVSLNRGDPSPIPTKAKRPIHEFRT